MRITVLGSTMIDGRNFRHWVVDCGDRLDFFFSWRLVARLMFKLELFFVWVRIVYPFCVRLNVRLEPCLANYILNTGVYINWTTHSLAYYQIVNEFFSPSLNSSKYLCFRASFIDMRLAGSRTIIFINKSNESASKWLNWVDKLAALNLGNEAFMSGNFTKLMKMYWYWTTP